MKLKEFQEHVFSYLSGDETDPEKYKMIRQSKGIDRRHRLDTYKKSFEGGVESCIEKDFEVTGMFLGVESFSHYLKSYFRECPPSTHYINEIGRNLPKYISRNLPQDASPFVIELAKLEWMMVESFYNYFDQKATKSELPPEGENGILVSPSLILFQNAWPLDEIWNQEEAREKKSSYLSVWCLDDRIVRVRSWNSLEFKVLHALQSSRSLEESISKLEDFGTDEEIAQVFSGCLKTWIELGLLEMLSA